MNYLLQVYQIRPSEMPYATRLFQQGTAAEVPPALRLAGRWRTEIGSLHQIVEMYQLEPDLAGGQPASAFVPVLSDEIAVTVQSNSRIPLDAEMAPADLWGEGVYELRRDQTVGGRLRDVVGAFEAVATIRDQHLHCLGLWTREGTLHDEAVSLWKFHSLEHRRRAYATLAADPAMEAHARCMGPLLIAQASSILAPLPAPPRWH